MPVALSVMVFFALCCQCASTLVVIQRETKSWVWPAFTFVYMTVLAYVDSLHYLDYAMIDKNEKLAAKEQYHDELSDVEEKESVINEQVARDKATDQYVLQLSSATILFAHVMFDDMFLLDHEIDRLKHLPGVKEHVEHFRTGFKMMSEEYIRSSLER